MLGAPAPRRGRRPKGRRRERSPHRCTRICLFETMIECPQVAELIAQKYLVGTKVFAPVDPDLKGVRTVAGDYNEKQLAERMDRPQLVGDIVAHWFRFGERRKTVCFATSVGHSVHIRDEFVRAGVRAEHVDGTTPKLERDATLGRLASGEIELVTNCAVLSEGWNQPAISCCILARPTKQMGLFRQMIGRVLRPAPRQDRCDRSRSFGRRFPSRLCRGSSALDAGSRSPRREPGASTAVHRAFIAASRMHAMRRHPHRRRSVLPLRIPAAAARRSRSHSSMAISRS